MAQENTKIMDALHASNMRDLVSKTNSLKIQKEDIVQVIHAVEGFFLIYYK